MKEERAPQEGDLRISWFERESCASGHGKWHPPFDPAVSKDSVAALNHNYPGIHHRLETFHPSQPPKEVEQ